VEIAVEGGDVGVVEEEVDAELSGDLVLVFLCFYLLLGHHFEPAEEAG
jgi:hypothetical protein